MSATLSTALRSKVARGPEALLRNFGDCRKAIARHLARRAAIADLRERDDRSLRDIGLARFQIQAAVHGLLAAPETTTWS
jgi:uncharacterized protein YjiS (DUF1127 family)